MNDETHVTVVQAADRLGVKRGRVFELLRDPNHPLTGPPPPGRGRGRVRMVDVASIDAELVLRATGTGSRPRRAATGADEVDVRYEVEQLAERVRQLEVRLDDTASRPDPDSNAELAQLREENRQLRFAKSKADAASDALRDAFDEQQKAAQLRRDAETHDETAFAALRRAEKARDDSIGT